MKKLLFFLLLTFLFSCEKEKDYCYTCRTVITTYGSPYATTPTVSTLTKCGLTESAAREAEEQLSSTETGGGITVTTITKCTKQ